MVEEFNMELVMDVAVEGVVNKEVAKVVKEFNKELVKEVNEGLLLWSCRNNLKMHMKAIS